MQGPTPGLGQHPVPVQAGGWGYQEQHWQEVTGAAGGWEAWHEPVI